MQNNEKKPVLCAIHLTLYTTQSVNADGKMGHDSALGFAGDPVDQVLLLLHTMQVKPGFNIMLEEALKLYYKQ